MSDSTPGTAMRRLLLDVTSSTSTEWNTGVQRVARSLACACLEAAPTLGVRCRTVHAVTRRNQFAPLRRRHERAGLPPACRVRARRGPLERLADRWNREVAKIRFRPGDVLFLPDVCWPFPMIPTLHKARNRGAVVGWLVYDLIPLRFPGLSEPTNEAILRRWVPESFSAIDFFVGISRATADDLAAYLDEQGLAVAAERISHITLSCGVRKQGHGSLPVRAELDAVFAARSGPVYLAVGTLEPRKNHRLLLDAFTRAWAQGSAATLVVVGRPGWGGDEIVAAVRGHAEHGRRLWLFTDVNDAELTRAYGRADALVMASRAEGFGLPIIEAERDGLRVLASDIPAHREVAGPDCRFFSPDDPAELADLVLAAAAARGGAAAPVRPGRHALATWDEAARELIGICTRMSRLGRKSP
jgi:glycosyltransferase involved in cell wall biosynthesis